MIKVQCISNNMGFYERLEIGKWYNVETFDIENDRGFSEDEYIVYGLGKKEHPLDSDSGVYNKKLFRTLDEKREFILNNILNHVTS